MHWYDSLGTKFQSRATHVVLLHLNVHDIQRSGDTFCELDSFLLEKEPLRSAEFLVTFDRARGIRFIPPEKEEKFLDLLGKLYPRKIPSSKPRPDSVDAFIARRDEPSYAVDLFSNLLPIGWSTEAFTSQGMQVQNVLEQCFGKEKVAEGKKSGAPLFLLWINYTESLAPPQACRSSFEDDRRCTVAFLTWAKNDAIRAANNGVILIAEELGNITAEFTSDTNGIILIEVPFPDIDDHLAAFQLLQNEFPQKELGLPLEKAARIAGGLSRRNLVQMARELLTVGQPFTEDLIFERKAEHLKKRSGGLAELIRSYWGRDAIGGLDMFKSAMDEIISAMESGDPLGVPQGILICGPPGTGKTVFVEALSYETSLPIVRLPNLRNMFVGMSEERQKFWLKLIISHAPCIVGIDEIDQQFLKRGTFFSGDTGVTERLQAQFFEVMSDTNLRGRILWVGMSNRPQDLDPALLREGRFDDVYPFLGPQTAEERSAILLAICHKLARQAERARQKLSHDLSDGFVEEFGSLAHGHYQDGRGWAECAPSLCGKTRADVQEIGFVGGEIEYIATAANRRARKERKPLGEDHVRAVLKTFLPKRSMPEFFEAVDAALRYSNNLDFIPPLYRQRALELRGIRNDSSTGQGQYL